MNKSKTLGASPQDPDEAVSVPPVHPTKPASGWGVVKAFCAIAAIMLGIFGLLLAIPDRTAALHETRVARAMAKDAYAQWDAYRQDHCQVAAMTLVRYGRYGERVEELPVYRCEGSAPIYPALPRRAPQAFLDHQYLSDFARRCPAVAKQTIGTVTVDCGRVWAALQDQQRHVSESDLEAVDQMVSRDTTPVGPAGSTR